MVRIQLYGVDHSPWVQIVMLALEGKGLTYELSAILTPTLANANGHVMPTMLYDNIPIAGSFPIMRFLDDRHPDIFPLTHKEDLTWQSAPYYQAMLEEIFLELALERLYPLPRKLFLFPWLFSKCRSTEVSLSRKMYGRIWLGIAGANFGSTLALFSASCSMWKRPCIMNSARLKWMLDALEDQLRSHQFMLATETPTYLDLAVYGIFQMTFTGLSEIKAMAIVERPKLVAFIERMNTIFPKYKSNYCSRVKDGRLQDLPVVECASLPMRLLSLSTITFLCTLGLPLLVPIKLVYIWWAAHLREASGRNIDWKGRWATELRKPL